MISSRPTPASPSGARKPRDLRLDLARGLTMLIIFVAHVPDNVWADFIPARMGFSSGAEAFVLCSGLAAGIAFGGVYARKGWAQGSLRIARRVGQLWLMQLIAFAAFAALMLGLDRLIGGDVLQQRYALSALVAAPGEMIAALATLRYVPIYFDILPLYIVLLASTPLVVLLARRSPRLLLGLMISLWLVAQAGPFNLPANPMTDAGWYFNPLAWQLLFFAGFGMSAGWFAVPARTPLRLALALAIVTISVPLTFWPFHEAFPWLSDVYVAIYPADAITRLHPLRLIHVLALAWLFAALLADKGAALHQRAIAPLITVGQQALPTFITGVFLSALGGVALDLLGRGMPALALINLSGITLLVLVAYAARAFKRTTPGTMPSPLQKEPKPMSRNSRLIKRTLSRRPVLAALAAAFMLAVSPPVAAMQPITLIVPFAAGGPTDIVARLAAEGMAQRLGRPIIIENVPGAGGATGTLRAARARPDGNTMVLGQMATHALTPILNQQAGYDPVQDFEAIGLIASAPMVLVAKAATPADTLPTFRDHVAQNAGRLSFGHAGLGATSQVACVLFNLTAMAMPASVAYRGTAPALTDLIAGQIDYACDQITSVAPFIRSGLVKGITLMSDARSPVLPDLATSAEQGMPDLKVEVWNGLLFPKGTAPEIVAAANQALNETLADGETTRRLTDLGASPPAAANTPGAFRALIAAENQRWIGVLRGLQ